jgi:hypothetical protein
LCFWPNKATAISAVLSPSSEHYCIACNIHAETVWFEKVKVGQLLEKFPIFLNYGDSSQDSSILPYPEPVSSTQFVLCCTVPLRSILILSYQLLNFHFFQ